MKRTSKLTAFVLSCLLAFALVLSGCQSSGTEAPVASPSTQSFTLSAAADLVFDLDVKGESLDSVESAGKALAASDYAYADGKLTLKNAYLKTLSVGSHEFTCTTKGGSCKVTVKVSAGAPAAEQNKVRYDYSNPADAVFTLELAGGSVTSVRFGETALTAEDYAVSGSTLTIKQSFIDVNLLENVENILTVATDGGSLELIIETFDSTPVFDRETYKFQKAGEDVSFSLSSGLDTNTVASVTCGDETLTADKDYVYENGKLTVNASYLDAKTVGIYGFRVTMSDANQTAFAFRIATYGLADGTHTLGDSGSLNDFESYDAGDSINLPNTLMNIAPTVVANGINGKSLSFEINSQDIHCFFSSGREFASDRVYCLKMKLKIEPAAKIIFNWGAGNDFCEINADGTIKYSFDARSKVTEEDGVFDIELYSVNTKQSGKFEVYVGTTSERSVLLMDDLMILETALPTTSPAAPSLPKRVFQDADVVYTDVNLPAGSEFDGVYLAGDKLTDSQAVYDAAAKTLTIKKEYLQGKTFPMSLTLRLSAPGDWQGTLASFDSSFEIDVNRSMTAVRSIVNYDSDLYKDLVIDTAKAFPGVAFSGVASIRNNGADVPYVFDSEAKTIALDAAYVAGLENAGHCIVITPEGGEAVNFYLFKNLLKNPVFDYDFEDSNFRPPYGDPIDNGIVKIENGQYVVNPVSAGTYFSTLTSFTLDASKTYQVKMRFTADAVRAFSFAVKQDADAAVMDLLQINFGGNGFNVPDNGGKVTGFVNRFEGNTYDVVLFLKGTDLRKFELWFQDWDGSNPCEHRFDEISVYETDFTF